MKECREEIQTLLYETGNSAYRLKILWLNALRINLRRPSSLATSPKVTCVLPARGLASPSAAAGRSPPLPHFSLPLPKFLNPCQSATTPAHSHVSPPGLSKEAPSPLAKVVPHPCQCSYHCCPRSPSRSLRSPALAPRKKISCSHPLLPIFTNHYNRGLLSLSA